MEKESGLSLYSINNLKNLLRLIPKTLRMYSTSISPSTYFFNNSRTCPSAKRLCNCSVIGIFLYKKEDTINPLIVATDALWKMWIALLPIHISHIAWKTLSEFTTVSTILLLLFYQSLFILTQTPSPFPPTLETTAGRQVKGNLSALLIRK